MLLITDITIKHVKTDRDVIINQYKHLHSYRDLHKPTKDMGVREELVKGRHFVNSRGERVCLGLQLNVQKTIGIYIEAFENLERQLDTLRTDYLRISEKNIKLTTELADLKYMSWWKRLNFLFKRSN